MCDVCIYKELVEFRGEMRSLFGALNKKVGSIMARLGEVEKLISDINDATNQVADRITALTDKLSTNMTGEEVDQIKTDLQASVDRLKVLGANPSQPVPPEPTPPPVA